MNIIIGNLSAQINESYLRSLFEQFGTVRSVKIMNNDPASCVQGLGLIEMDSPQNGKMAVTKLHNTVQYRQSITVNELRPRNNGFDRTNINIR